MFSWCEFLSGWFSGIFGLIVGHPADTVKVLQQVHPNLGAVGLISIILRKEGIRGFYKGMLFPLLSSGITNSIFFGFYANSLRTVFSGGNQEYCCEGTREHWHLKLSVAASIGGAVSCLIACPVDMVKTRLQTTEGFGIHPTRLVVKICEKAGIRGLYRGLVPMVLREVPSSILYIVAHEHFICFFEAGTNGKIPTGASHSIHSELISGGIAGSLSWLGVLPLDVVKTRIQFDSIDKPIYKGTLDCFKQIYRHEGLNVFFSGSLVSVLRGFPVNAVSFYMYHVALKRCANY